MLDLSQDFALYVRPNKWFKAFKNDQIPNQWVDYTTKNIIISTLL